MLPLNTLRWGHDAPQPERHELRAGPLTMRFESGDLRYIQSVRTVALRPGAATDLWVAVTAGENDAAFARNADAAAEDISARRQQLSGGLVAELDPSAELEWSYAASAPSVATAVKKPVCGKDCTLRLRAERGARRPLQTP